jgi:hypothetical protein
MGRPSTFSAELANEICSRLAKGETLLNICKDENMPARSSVYLWRTENEEFSDKFARARDLGFDAIADDKSDDPASRRVRVQTRLDLLGRWSTRYSTKTSNEHSGPGGGSIKTTVEFVNGLPDQAA